MSDPGGWQRRWSAVMMGNYAVPQVELVRGKGCRVVDAEGREYLDLTAGIATSSLGHAHPAVVEAVSRQVGELAHTSNLAAHEPGIAVAERLVGLVGPKLAPSARVFFCQDGAGANEAALKLARLHGKRDPGGGRDVVVAADGSFHGRTMGALSITGSPAKRDPFAPLPGPVRFVPYGDTAALAAAVRPDTAALFLEPIQGEAGVIVPPVGYLRAAREICDNAGALLVMDEVQSGIGRTGEWFASLADGVVPDVITLAKGLAGGLPLGACLAIGDASSLFTPGAHGSTFGGNPVSCAAARAVIDVIEGEGLLESVRRLGGLWEAAFAAVDDELLMGHRGVGLWWALDLSTPAASVFERVARDAGFLVNAVRPDAVRLAPPLIITEAEATEFADALPHLLARTREVR